MNQAIFEQTQQWFSIAELFFGLSNTNAKTFIRQHCIYQALSKLTQQNLSSAEHFFELSKSNAEYSIIIWVKYYVPFLRLRKPLKKAPLEPRQL